MNTTAKARGILGGCKGREIHAGMSGRPYPADGGEEKKEYDAQGHLIKETDPLGYEMVYTYDENGVVILRTDRHAFQPAGYCARGCKGAAVFKPVCVCTE